MSDKLPLLGAKELISALEKLGFVNTRRKGSHFRFVHPDGRRTTIPIHKGKIYSTPLNPVNSNTLARLYASTFPRLSPFHVYR